MAAGEDPETAVDRGACPFLRPAEAEWIYPVEGICEGLPDGMLMIPSVEEYRTWCTTTEHIACPIYRSRLGEGGLDAWLEAQLQRWGMQSSPGPS